MCHYSSRGSNMSNIIVTAFARRAPKIILSIHITTSLIFFAYVNISMYIDAGCGFHLSFFFFLRLLLVANFTLYRRGTPKKYQRVQYTTNFGHLRLLFLSLLSKKGITSRLGNSIHNSRAPITTCAQITSVRGDLRDLEIRG